MRNLQYIPASGQTAAFRTTIRCICIHTMQNQEKPNGAIAVAKWFHLPQAPQGATPGINGYAPKAGAHLCVDNRNVIECVKPEHVAWSAPNLNRDGYHVEHTGKAEQSTDEWHDTYSTDELRLSAWALAPVCVKYRIEPVMMTVEQVADRVSKGFCSHLQVTQAFHTVGGHVDPGPNFPWAEFLTMVAAEIENLK